MTRRLLIPVLLAAAVLPLTACFGPTPEPTPTEPPRPPSMDGEWVIERVIVSATDETAYPVGTENTLYVLFVEEECTEAECTGTLISGISLEDREVNPAEGTFVSTAEGLTYEFPETLTPCIADSDSSVIAEDAYGNKVSYDATLTEVDDGEVLAFEATGLRVYRTTQAGLDTGVCRPDDGEIEYELTATRGE